MALNPYYAGFDPKVSRAYDPTYRPSKSLAQLVLENPQNQFLTDRLAEQQDQRVSRTRSLFAVARRVLARLRRAPGTH